MIYTQPVSYELEQIKTPVVLIIGDKDTTPIGENGAPSPAVRSTLGQCPELGKEAARRSSASDKPDRRQNFEPSPHPT
jgi:hypothetical protein